MIRDVYPGSGLFPIPDPGVKKAPDPGSATLYNHAELTIVNKVMVAMAQLVNMMGTTSSPAQNLKQYIYIFFGSK